MTIKSIASPPSVQPTVILEVLVFEELTFGLLGTGCGDSSLTISTGASDGSIGSTVWMPEKVTIWGRARHVVMNKASATVTRFASLT